ncbi:MAG: ImmA/IrrE family metallo-endopeptidase [Nitrospirae bacterium]|nr:ImmA/IrrE family metallo-endopeptidase [Nitrospirota bacterium]
MESLKAPILNYEQIYQEAEKFLKDNHPQRTLPVPIHEIIDIKLGIHVVPKFMMEKNIGLVGFLSNDFSTIYIDENVHDYQEARFRFTLAHEIGHLMLHKNMYKNLAFRTPEEWKSIQLRLKDDVRKWFEWQANCFAGLVLVPRDELGNHVNNCIKAIDEEGIGLNDNWDFAWESIADYLAREIFSVSPETILSRLHYDRIRERYK